MAQTARHRPGQEAGADDQAMGGPVDDHSTRPVRVFEVRPLRSMDLANLPAFRTLNYFDALVAARLTAVRGRASSAATSPCVSPRRAISARTELATSARKSRSMTLMGCHDMGHSTPRQGIPPDSLARCALIVSCCFT